MNIKKIIVLSLLVLNLNSVHSESLTYICKRHHIDKDSVLKILKPLSIIQKDIKDVGALYPTVTTGSLSAVIIIETFDEKIFFIWSKGNWDDGFTACSIDSRTKKDIEGLKKHSYSPHWLT